IDALFVDPLGGFQNVEVHTDGSSKMDERLQILGEAESAETEACFEELSADWRIETHDVRYFIDVRADFFAQIGENVCVANLEREKRIRGVFDQFGAVDCGDEKRRIRGSGATVLVDRARKFAFKNRAIDF